MILSRGVAVSAVSPSGSCVSLLGVVSASPKRNGSSIDRSLFRESISRSIKGVSDASASASDAIEIGIVAQNKTKTRGERNKEVLGGGRERERDMIDEKWKKNNEWRWRKSFEDEEEINN